MIASYNFFEISMTKSEAQNMNVPGTDNAASVRAYLAMPKFKRQFTKIDPVDIADQLAEYGAWSAEDLADAEMNQLRILWISAGNILEESRNR